MYSKCRRRQHSSLKVNLYPELLHNKWIGASSITNVHCITTILLANLFFRKKDKRSDMYCVPSDTYIHKWSHTYDMISISMQQIDWKKLITVHSYDRIFTCCPYKMTCIIQHCLVCFILLRNHWDLLLYDLSGYSFIRCILLCITVYNIECITLLYNEFYLGSLQKILMQKLSGFLESGRIKMFHLSYYGIV